MRHLLASIVAIIALMLSSSAIALAGGASTNASCIGIGSSAGGQTQTRDDIALFVRQLPGSPGAIYSSFAKQHAGSETACFGTELPVPPHP